MAATDVASAQIQRCIDSDGRATFTDGICPKTSTNGKSIKANQKYVGSEPGKGQNTDWAAQNEAFNQRHAQREQRESNERVINNFISTPLPPGVKYPRLTTYSNRPSKLDSK